MVTDPICEMVFEPNEAEGYFDYDNKRYYFCSTHCLKTFKSDPLKYLKPQAAAPQILGAQYTCPMHPEILVDQPGNCPKCGMSLEPILPNQADDGELKDMQRRFLFSLFFSGPLFFLTMLEMRLPFHIPGWLQLGLAIPAVLYGGIPFYKRAWVSLKTRTPNMFTLIAMGTLAAFAYSVVSVFVGNLFVYFEAAAVIITLVLLGQVLELRARRLTNQAIEKLMGLAPKTTVQILNPSEEREIPIENVEIGFHLRIRPGDKVPVDGTIIEGSSYVNESMLTGEPIPSLKTKGSQVIGGTLNTSGSFVMRAEKVGEHTLMSQIIRLVASAQRSKAPIQNLADKVSYFFVPAVILIALLTFVIWFSASGIALALVNAVAVLIIACPCALGLATPMSITVGIGRCATLGILIKDAAVIEVFDTIDTLVVDKTGTLTEGQPSLNQVRSFVTPDNVLQLAASLENNSEHPLAKAFLEEARKSQVSLLKVENFNSVTGRGLEGEIQSQSVKLGNLAFMKENQIDISDAIKETTELFQSGNTVLFLAVNAKLAGYFSVSDQIKASSRTAIDLLKRAGLEIIMLTGDDQRVAQAVAKQLGISQVIADVLPPSKGKVIEDLKRQGRKVAMAGDGINDAPALALADVGIAMGTGTDIAIETASVTLVKGDLRGIHKAKTFSKQIMHNIRQNLFFAFVYNFLGVPIAAGILYPPFGILMSPMLASAAMSLSSVSVIANSLRLRFSTLN